MTDSYSFVPPADLEPGYSFTPPPDLAQKEDTYSFSPPDSVATFKANDVPVMKSELDLNPTPSADVGFEMSTPEKPAEFTYIPPQNIDMFQHYNFVPDPTVDTKDSLLNAVEAGGKSLLYSFGNVAAGVARFEGDQYQNIAELLDQTWAGDALKKAGEGMKEWSSNLVAANEADLQKNILGPTSSLFANVGGSIGTMLPALMGGGLTAAAGATNLMATEVGSALGGASQFFLSRQQGLDKGLSDWEANMYGARDGLYEFLGEQLPMSKVLERAPLLSKYWKTLLWELPTETATTVAQFMNYQATLEPDMPSDEFHRQLTSQIAQTIAAVPFITGGQATLVRGMEKAQAVADNFNLLLDQERKGGGTVDERNAKRILDAIISAGKQTEEEQQNSVVTFVGDHDQQAEDNGKRKVNPTGDELSRVGGLLSSEHNGWMGSYTFGSQKEEPVTDTPEPDTEAQLAQTQVATDLSKFTNQTPKQRWHQQVTRLVQDFTSGWKSDLDITVIQNHHQLPDEMHAFATDTGRPELLQGLYDGGNRIWLLSDNFDKIEDVPRILTHEAVGHWGVEQVVPSWNRLVPQVLKFAPTNMKETWNEVSARDGFNELADREKAREVLATHAEMNPDSVNPFLTILKGEFQQFMRDKFGMNIAFNNADVASLMRKARNAVEKGTQPKNGKLGPVRATKYRSDFDPAVRNWGESWFGTSDFPIFEDMSTNRFQRFYEGLGGSIFPFVSDEEQTRAIALVYSLNQKAVTAFAKMLPAEEKTVSKWNEAKLWVQAQPLDRQLEILGHALGRDLSDWKKVAQAPQHGKPAIFRGYHGSHSADVEHFDDNMLGSFTQANSARQGHFFAGQPTNTSYYALENYMPDDMNNENLVPEDRKALFNAMRQEAIDNLLARGEVNKAVDKHGRVVYESADGHAVSNEVGKIMGEFNRLPFDQQGKIFEALTGRLPKYLAPTVYPVYIAASNPAVIDLEGAGYKEIPWNQTISEAFARGHDVVVLMRARDPDPDNVIIVRKGRSHRIRSVNAKFDTEQKHSPLLLAARGKLHRVVLNKEMYLDLEKPLVQQGQKVQEALRAAGVVPSGITGQELYDNLIKIHGSKEEVSKFLDKAGIHGATWQEGFKGELVRNYATFSKENAAAVTADNLRGITGDKAKAQSLLSDDVRERHEESPAITFRKRVELFHKALKMSKDFSEIQLDELTRFNWFIKYFYGIEELADANPNLVQLQSYLEASRAWWATKGKWTTDANARVRLWRKMVNSGQMQQFDTFLYEADIASEKLGRALTADELSGLVKDKGLNRLGEEQLHLATQIWDDYRKAFDAVGKALEFDIKRKIISDPFAQQAAIKEMWQAIEKAKDRNFMPKSNFGEWTIEFKARNDLTYNEREFKAGEVVHYSTHATETDRNNAFIELRKTFRKDDYTETRSRLHDTKSMDFMGVPDSFVNALLDRAELDDEARTEVEATLERLQHEQSPTSRLMRQVLKDTKAYGYDENSLRVYASFMQRFSNQISKLTHGPDMQLAIDSLANETQGDFTKKSEILDWLRQHRKYMSDPGNELTFLRSLGFTFFIGGVAKSALVNGFQVPLVTLPYLSDRHNPFSAMKALTKNIDAYFQQFDKAKPRTYSADKLRMFSDLRALLNESFANELAAVAEGSTLEDMVNKHSNALRATDRVVRATVDKFAFMFHHTELFNRYITAGAAYDLAIEKGKGHHEASLEAAEAVRWTQGEYARYNRPLAMRGKRSAAFLFMRYMAHMLSIYFGNDRAKWGVLGMLILASGLLGLPFAENALDIFDLLASEFKRKTGWHDPQVQSRLELMKFIEGLRADPMNPFAEFIPSADSLMHGFSRRLPLPFTDQRFDVSSSLSMGRVLPGTEELAKGPGQIDIGNILLQAGGALASIPLGVWNAMSSNNPDKWKAWEQAMPMAVRNVSAAYRWYQRGYEENSQGQKLMEFDPEKDMSTLVYKGLGFTPTELNQVREVDWMQSGVARFYGSWRSAVMRDFGNAIIEKNEENIKATQSAWIFFNKQAPAEYAIGPQDMQRSVGLRVRYDVMHSLGLPAQKRYIQAYRDIDEIAEKAR